jgi:hypothetical protein
MYIQTLDCSRHGRERGRGQQEEDGVQDIDTMKTMLPNLPMQIGKLKLQGCQTHPGIHPEIDDGVVAHVREGQQ